MKTSTKEYPVVNTEDVLEVLNAEEVTTEDLYAVGVDLVKSRETIPAPILGKILVELTRRLSILEDRVKSATSPDTGKPRRACGGPKTPPPQAPAGVETPNCPGCGLAMVLRSNRTTNERFFGCQQYPKCKRSVQLKDLSSSAK